MEEKKIHGNTDGISDAAIADMVLIYDMTLARDAFFDIEIARQIAKHSSAINREISVLISRSGKIKHISIGSFDRVEMPQLSEKRSTSRLCGIRCIHTHPKGSGMLSAVDYATLESARFDAMAAIGVENGVPKDMFAAFLTDETGKHSTFGPVYPKHYGAPALMQAVQEADRLAGRASTHDLQKEQEYALLVGIKQHGMDELKELAKTAGAKIIAVEVQQRESPDRGTYIGRGKVEELSLKVTALNIDLVIVNSELSPIQLRNIEERLGVKVVDRTALILDIFAMRAKSKEGCLQVELAQLKYMLPRLTGKGTSLSRQAGGIASRGPGETKLELDRRHIRGRIHNLEQEIKLLKKQRDQRRNRRDATGVSVVTLAGYTNAGKSTLLNALTGADAYVEDKLFATLDTLSRRTEVEGREVVFTDTVGFVQDLPHDLVDAFRSTLEEVSFADLILHVVDGSSPDLEEHKEVVEQVLGSLGAADMPIILVFNKSDIAQEPVPPGMIAISARTGEGLEELRQAIAKKLAESFKTTKLSLPYSRSDLISVLHERGKVLSEEYGEDEMLFEVVLPDEVLKQIENELLIKK